MSVPVDPASPDGVMPVGQSSGWTLAASEEFRDRKYIAHAGRELIRFRANGPLWQTRYPDYVYDPAMQNPHAGAPSHNEQQRYAPEGTTVSGGTLKQTMTKQPADEEQRTRPGFQYVSGVLTNHPQGGTTYGYYEARMRLPGGPSAWPAFWLFFQDWDAENYYELDIMECFGSSSEVGFNNHCAGTTVNNVATPVLVTNWHTYGLAWTPTDVRWYVDGTQVAHETNPAASPSVPLCVIFNLAAQHEDADEDYPSRAASEIDYYRRWTAT